MIRPELQLAQVIRKLHIQFKQEYGYCKEFWTVDELSKMTGEEPSTIKNAFRRRGTLGTNIKGQRAVYHKGLERIYFDPGQ